MSLSKKIINTFQESKPLKLITIIAAFLICFQGCSQNKNKEDNKIVIGVQNDVQTINPMYEFNVMEGNLIDLLFLKPAEEIWNDSLGRIDFAPMLAKKWEWSNDSSSITLYLKDDSRWSDGKPITVDDVIFSLETYSDPKADTRFSGQFGNFNTIDGEKIDSAKTFKIISPRILTINFKKEALPSLLDINLEVLPKHIWEKYSAKEMETAKENFEPVTSGAFKLKKWQKESSIILDADSSSFLFNPDNVQEIIFKIIPDYTSRITQLKTGEIDLMDNVKSEDVSGLQSNNDLKIISLRGRDYDYVGWNNNEPGKSRKPNKFFSSPEVRRALTYAINREEILHTFLEGYGEICKTPVSPMFKSYFDKSINAYKYDPDKAKGLLAKNGWVDKNKDGVLEKNNVKFDFDLYINSGNPRREYAATIIKNNLKAVGINVHIQKYEMGTFVNGLMNRKFNAWIAGWTIPVPIELNPYWNSDKEKGYLNFPSYHNTKVDSLLNKLKERIPEIEKINVYKKLQVIFHNDEPVTFLYWFDNILACNKKLDKVKFSILGLVKNAWEWKIE